MSTTLSLYDIELWTRIGVPAAERTCEQRILVDIDLPYDASAATAADDVALGMDYEALVRDLRKLATEERKTIERLADDIARMILTTYKPERVTVTVRKFPIPGVREICFTVTRRT